LYSDGEYSTALTAIEEIDANRLNSKERQEYELLKALIVYENNILDGRALLFQYLADYPESAKREMLYCYIAKSYYHTGNYDQACSYFGECNFKRLTPRQRDEATLLYALSLLNCGNEGAAENLLMNLSLTSKVCNKDAEFYLAVINYNRGNLDEAYKGFKNTETDQKYSGESQYYTAGIYLKNGDVARAKNLAED
jgi:TolA-binding protein